ncbi:MAG: Ltp family lipoprotein [Firmicutes bacterium]|nr:Ltp family lipoprotein [Bacillota bacterium]
MKRRYLAIILALVLIVCSACTKKSPDKPAGGGNDSKFAATQSESSSAESSQTESSSAETSTEETSVPMEEESSNQESSAQESSETSSKPEESSETSSEQPEESSEESSEESYEESSEIEIPSGDYTQSQLDAWNEAEDIYTSEGIGNSYDGLVQKVMDAGFDYEDAVWAVDQLTAAFPIDWYDEALQYAQSIIDMRASYRGDVRYSLENLLFTEDQIDYAIENIDWYSEAIDEMVHYYHILESVDRYCLIDTLLDKDYTYDETMYAFDYLGETTIDWKKEALRRLNRCITIGCSKSQILSSLEEGGYTEEEINYAFENYGEIDWNGQALGVAMDYLERYAISPNQVREYLENAQFTEEEINYAISSIDTWELEALQIARQMIDEGTYSEKYLAWYLEQYGFTYGQATYGAAYCEADWIEEATAMAGYFLVTDPSMSYSELYGYLTGSPYFFTEEQANAACAAHGLTP